MLCVCTNICFSWKGVFSLGVDGLVDFTTFSKPSVTSKRLRYSPLSTPLPLWNKLRPEQLGDLSKASQHLGVMPASRTQSLGSYLPLAMLPSLQRGLMLWQFPWQCFSNWWQNPICPKLNIISRGTTLKLGVNCMFITFDLCFSPRLYNCTIIKCYWIPPFFSPHKLCRHF